MCGKTENTDIHTKQDTTSAQPQACIHTYIHHTMLTAGHYCWCFLPSFSTPLLYLCATLSLSINLWMLPLPPRTPKTSTLWAVRSIVRGNDEHGTECWACQWIIMGDRWYLNVHTHLHSRQSNSARLLPAAKSLPAVRHLTHPLVFAAVFIKCVIDSFHMSCHDVWIRRVYTHIWRHMSVWMERLYQKTREDTYICDFLCLLQPVAGNLCDDLAIFGFLGYFLSYARQEVVITQA